MIIDHTQSLLSALLKSHLTRTLPPRPPQIPQTLLLDYSLFLSAGFCGFVVLQGLSALTFAERQTMHARDGSYPCPRSSENTGRRECPPRLAAPGGRGGARQQPPPQLRGCREHPRALGEGLRAAPSPCPGSWVSTADTLLSGPS